MKKRITLYLLIFAAGYYFGHRNVAMASQLLWFTWASLIGGFVAGVKWMQLKSRFRGLVGFRILGLEVRIKRKGIVEHPGIEETPAELPAKQADVIPLLKPQPAPSMETEAQPPACDFCHGEPIVIAGTKHPMPCPKCKKGGNKKETG